MPKRLDLLEREADRLLQWSLHRRANDATDEERFRFLTLALDRVHQAVERQRHRVREPALEPSE
jgi:hypothetical protein